VNITQAPARPQCPRCQLLDLRGGTILPAANSCAALDASGLSDPATAILVRMAFLLARQGQCPNFKPFEAHPDAYRALDLPRSKK
jgi:hypothetical protein